MCRNAELTMPSVWSGARLLRTDGSPAPEHSPLRRLTDHHARRSADPDHPDTLEFAGASSNICGTYRLGHPSATGRSHPCSILTGIGEVAPSPRTVHGEGRPRRAMCSETREILL